jgi:hypothetical protein|tara:strand:- start:32 stop:982 length:951 start_codon:yes stop_codon:yes gene_type:complete
MRLFEKYKKITKPKNKNPKNYNTIKLNRNSEHFLGIDGSNQVTILFNASKPKGKEEHLNNLTLEHNIQCTIYLKNKKKKQKFSILKCTSKEEHLKEIFLKGMDGITGSLPNNISEEKIYELTSKLVKLFEKISKKRNYDLTGFWGELFTIKHLKLKELLIEAWHPNNNDIFDFLIRNQALEIKTTTSNDRKHHFSYEQLNSKNLIIIVGSVMIRKSRAGISLLDLKKNIMEEINKKELKEKLQEMYNVITGSKSQRELDNAKYSYDYAKENIMFFDSKNVPRIKETPMHGIKNIKFESNLNGAKNIDNFSSYEFLK